MIIKFKLVKIEYGECKVESLATGLEYIVHINASGDIDDIYVYDEDEACDRAFNAVEGEIDFYVSDPSSHLKDMLADWWAHDLLEMRLEEKKTEDGFQMRLRSMESYESGDWFDEIYQCIEDAMLTYNRPVLVLE